MKVLTVRSFGYLEQDLKEISCIPDKKVRIRVKYAGVGFADVMAVRGGYPLTPQRPFSPGYEFFGVIQNPGEYGDRFRKGERVMGMLPRMGAYQEILDLEPKWVVHVPEIMSGETAAMLPLNYLTAMALIENMGHLSRGQSLFIHGAAGGVGLAVLEISRLKGIRAFGTAAVDKHPLIEERGGIPFDYKDPDWEKKLKKINPNGVDAAFDAFGGCSRAKAWSVLAPKGTLVCYGFAPTADGGYWPMIKGLFSIGAKKLLPNGKRVRICGTPGIIKKKPAWYKDAMQRIQKWAVEGRLDPVLYRIYPWDRAEDAHKALADRRVKGKALIYFG